MKPTSMSVCLRIFGNWHCLKTVASQIFFSNHNVQFSRLSHLTTFLYFFWKHCKYTLSKLLVTFNGIFYQKLAESFVNLCTTIQINQNILLASLYGFPPQFYIQLVLKAPLCITLTISDQNHYLNREWQPILAQKNILPKFFKILLPLCYVTFQCGRYNVFISLCF